MRTCRQGEVEVYRKTSSILGRFPLSTKPGLKTEGLSRRHGSDAVFYESKAKVGGITVSEMVGLRTPAGAMVPSHGAKQQLLLYFVRASLDDGRRLPMLSVRGPHAGIFDKHYLHVAVKPSSELDDLCDLRGRPMMTVSDIG